jgi:hypothetical protein
MDSECVVYFNTSLYVLLLNSALKVTFWESIRRSQLECRYYSFGENESRPVVWAPNVDEDEKDGRRKTVHWIKTRLMPSEARAECQTKHTTIWRSWGKTEIGIYKVIWLWGSFTSINLFFMNSNSQLSYPFKLFIQRCKKHVLINHGDSGVFERPVWEWKKM